MAEENIKNILLGLPVEVVAKLDKLCSVNDLSRPKVARRLIEKADAELTADPKTRISMVVNDE